jgi:hypothetical protein
MRAATSLSFFREIALKQRPEVVGDGHAVLVTCAFEAHRNRSSSFINVRKRHTQDAMSSDNVVPITDALSGTDEKRQDRSVTPRSGGCDQLLRSIGFEGFWYFSRHSPPELACSLATRGIPTHHAVTVTLGRHRNGIIAVVPGSISEVFMLANPKIKVGSQHTEAMVDRSRLTFLVSVM